MCILVIEMLMAYLLGGVTAIYHNSRRKSLRIAGGRVLKLLPLIYVIAVFGDIYLPLPFTPSNLFESFIVNSYVILCFYVGYLAFYVFAVKPAMKSEVVVDG